MSTQELVVYIVINNDVNMGKGKIVAQACHVIAEMTAKLISNKPGLWLAYIRDGTHPKICLKATSIQMEELKNKYQGNVFYVHDAGRTQVPSGTLTALAFPPMLRSEVYAELTSLKLL